MRMAVVDAARANGVNKGYATFWNANITTELSDGEIDVAAVEFVHENGSVSALRPFLWLETDEDFEMNAPDEPVFLLVGMFESVYAPFSIIGCSYLLVQAPLWRADLTRSSAEEMN